MPTTLDEILASTRRSLPAVRARRPSLERAAADAARAPSFRGALARETVGLIAEVKRRSPSAGEIRATLDPVERAAGYVAGGAAAISVLTDGPYFGGSLDDLAAVARAVSAPVLRKDFILDETQLLEARAAGAAAVLLIVRALDAEALARLHREARALGLDVLVEIHNERELGTALDAGAEIIGVNSRDLDTFRIDIAEAWKLLARVPADKIAVAESGMATAADVERAAEAGADAALIGTALSASENPQALATAITGVRRRGR